MFSENKAHLLCFPTYIIFGMCLFLRIAKGAPEPLPSTRQELATLASSGSNIEFFSRQLAELEEMNNQVQALLQMRTNETKSTVVNSRGDKDRIPQLNSSKPHFVDFNNGCGGVVNGNNGNINYIRHRTDDDLEECMWTILTDNIMLHFTANQSSHTHTSMTLLSVNRCNGSLEIIGKLDRSSRTLSISSGVAILVFTSAAEGANFQLNYRSSGDTRIGAVFTATHNMSHFGVSRNRELEISNSAQYYHIFTQGSTQPNLVFDTDFLSGAGTFAKFPGVCDHESMTAYELVHGSTLRQLAKFPEITGMNGSECPSSIEVPYTPHWFKSTVGSYIVVYRTSTQDPKAMLSWSTTYQDRRATTSCGGLVFGNSGYISYKDKESYKNNELCKWHVYPKTPKSKIQFTHVSDGLEACCDKVEVEMQPNNFTALKNTTSQRVLSVTATHANVRFKTDHSITGEGFFLSYKTIDG